MRYLPLYLALVLLNACTQSPPRFFDKHANSELLPLSHCLLVSSQYHLFPLNEKSKDDQLDATITHRYLSPMMQNKTHLALHYRCPDT